MKISRRYFWWFVSVVSTASVFYPLPVTGFSIRFSQTRSPWNEIPDECTPVLEINSRSVLQQIGNYTAETATSIAWLPIQRVDLGGWYWTNDEYYGDQISTKEWEVPGMDCAVLQSQDQIIDDAFCDSQYGNYICQGLKQCDPMATICLDTTHENYNIYNKAGTWYAASEGCSSRNQTLAAFSKVHLKATLKLIDERTKKWAKIWIGLRKREFRVGFGSKFSARKKLTIYAWGPKQPASTKNFDCVLINTTAEKSVWQTGSCNVSYHHICKGGAVNSTITANEHERAEDPCGIFNTFSVALLIYSILTTVLCAVLCIFLVIIPGQTTKSNLGPERPSIDFHLDNKNDAKVDGKNEEVSQEKHNGNMFGNEKEPDRNSTTGTSLSKPQGCDKSKSLEELSSHSPALSTGDNKSNSHTDETDETQHTKSGEDDNSATSKSDESRDFVDLVNSHTAPWIPKTETSPQHTDTHDNTNNAESQESSCEITEGAEIKITE